MTPEPTTAAKLTITPRQRTLVLVGTMVGMLVAAVSQTIVTTVLPTIARDLNGADMLTWVFTGAMLATAVVTPLFGKLSDLYGRRNLYILGVATFLVGTLVCAMAGTMDLLVAGRVIQGIGMGAIMPLAMAIIADVVPANERGKWQGLMGAVFGLATVLGPLSGGWINDAVGWRWTFWLVVPLAVVALVLIVTQMHIPFERRHARVDWPGFVAFGIGLSALLLALSEGGKTHPWDSARIVGLLATSAVALVAFVFVELRASEPLIPMHLFRDRNVWTTTVASLAIGGGMYAGTFYVPLFMQSVAGLSSSDSGEALIPLMLGLIFTSIGSGILVSKTGRYRGMIIVGPVIGAGGLWLLAQLGPDATVLDTAWRVAILGAGLGLVMQNVMLVAQNTVELRFTGVVTSLLTLARTLGGTICVAILGTVYANHLADDMREQFAKVPRAFAGSLAKVDQDAILGGGAGLPGAVQDAIRTAAADSLTHVFTLAIPFLAIAFVAALLIRTDELSNRAAIDVVDEIEHELADLVPMDPEHAPLHGH